MSMKRILASITFLLVLSACSHHPPLTPVSAANLAAQLANERCYHEFGERPFTGDDFDATLAEGRWEWGTLNGGPIDGYEVEVSFAKTGEDRRVVIRGQDRE
jgi:hypothetical protein